MANGVSHGLDLGPTTGEVRGQDRRGGEDERKKNRGFHILPPRVNSRPFYSQFTKVSTDFFLMNIL
jgi:hypothetical protein